MVLGWLKYCASKAQRLRAQSTQTTVQCAQSAVRAGPTSAGSHLAVRLQGWRREQALLLRRLLLQLLPKIGVCGGKEVGGQEMATRVATSDHHWSRERDVSFYSS